MMTPFLSCCTCIPTGPTWDSVIEVLGIVISAIVVLLSWRKTARLNRQNEIAKVRLSKRLPMLDMCLEIFRRVQDAEGNPFVVVGFSEFLAETRMQVQLYGQDDEISIFEEMIKAMESGDLQLSNQKLNELIPLARKKIRSELEFQTLGFPSKA